MQISLSANTINLSRYGGTVTEAGARKTLSVRIGSFPVAVMAEFNRSATEEDGGRIPYQIYRSTTPDEQQQIIDFLRNHRLAEVTQRVKDVTKEMTAITALLPEAELDARDTDEFLRVCTGLTKALRSPGPRAEQRARRRTVQMASAANAHETKLNNDERPDPS